MSQKTANVNEFPHAIVSSFLFRGRCVSTTPVEGRQVTVVEEDEIVEIVIDDQGRAWRARNGFLLRLGLDERDAQITYRDTRTNYTADRGEGTVKWKTKSGRIKATLNAEDPLSFAPPDLVEGRDWQQLLRHW